MSLKKKSHLTLGHNQDTNPGLHRENPVYDPSNHHSTPTLLVYFSYILYTYATEVSNLQARATSLLCFMTSYIYNNYLSNTGPVDGVIKLRRNWSFFS